MDRITGELIADIKKRRQGIGVSQEALAKEAGVSYRTVLRFEKGSHAREKNMEKIIATLERLEKSGPKPGSWWLSHKRTLNIELKQQKKDKN